AVPLLQRMGTGRVLWARAADPTGSLAGPAAWLRLPDGVVGLAPPGAPLGPLWINRPEPWPVLTEGATVTVDEAGLRGPDGVLLLERRLASAWRGPLPDARSVSAAPARALVVEALRACGQSALLGEPWSEAVEPALSTIGRLEPLDSLSTVARALGGLGPGLTPAGDDALSGVFFAFRAMAGPSVEPALAAVAGSVRSGELSAAVLAAAASGSHIEPVHDLVMAAAANEKTVAVKAAMDLDRYGSTSGRDVAYGLRLAFTRR
ncbi:MAG TPA: DUF2877 domain-containing protein, partial [Acidimicrobiia bacterium]|nr:DUF2877 domain-containing protein [Acidimicrobiia bacterium]